MTPTRPSAGSVSLALRLSLSAFQRLFAPFLPFVCEEVWSWWQEGSIHRASLARRRASCDARTLAAGERRARGPRPGARRRRPARGAQGQVRGAPPDAGAGRPRRRPRHGRSASRRSSSGAATFAAGAIERSQRRGRRSFSVAVELRRAARPRVARIGSAPMERTLIARARRAQSASRSTSAAGSRRSATRSAIQFVIVRDETGMAQAVLPERGARASSTSDLGAHGGVGHHAHRHGRRGRARQARRAGAAPGGARTSSRSPNPSSRSPPSRRSTSASTGATWTCAAPTGG